MSAQRLIGGAAGWAGFGVALGVLLALNGSRTVALPGVRAPREPAPATTVDPGIVVPVPAPPRTSARPAAAAVSAWLLKPLRALVTSLACGLALGLLLALVLPLAFGMRPLVVLSGSMEPVLRVGDVTVVERIAPRQARVGDVVTFKAPDTGRITTHRLRAVRRGDGGRFVFTTKGDANNAVERWTLPPEGRLSRAVYRVPIVGHALLAIATPLGWMLLVGVPLLALGAHEIVRIWRRVPETGDGAAAV
jgi:signal peptidase